MLLALIGTARRSSALPLQATPSAWSICQCAARWLASAGPDDTSASGAEPAATAAPGPAAEAAPATPSAAEPTGSGRTSTAHEDGTGTASGTASGNLRRGGGRDRGADGAHPSATQSLNTGGGSNTSRGSRSTFLDGPTADRPSSSASSVEESRLFVKISSRFDLSHALPSDVIDFLEAPHLGPHNVRSRCSVGRVTTLFVQLPTMHDFNRALQLDRSFLGPVQVNVESARGHTRTWEGLAPRTLGHMGAAARGSMVVLVYNLPHDASVDAVKGLFQGFDLLGHAVALRGAGRGGASGGGAGAGGDGDAGDAGAGEAGDAAGARQTGTAAIVRLASADEGFRAVRELTGRQLGGQRVTVTWMY